MRRMLEDLRERKRKSEFDEEHWRKGAERRSRKKIGEEGEATRGEGVSTSFLMAQRFEEKTELKRNLGLGHCS